MRIRTARDSMIGALLVVAFLCSAGNAATGANAIPPAPVDSREAIATMPATLQSTPPETPGPSTDRMNTEDGLWMQVNPAPHRLSHSIMYDPLRKRAVMFGGSDGLDRNDTWVLHLDPGASWVPQATLGARPAPRRLHTAVYDPVRDRMIVFGGYADSYFDDVWELTLSGAPTWHQLTPTGGPPAARAGHVAVYDPIGDRMVVFGGHDGVSMPSLRRNDVWALSLAGTPAWTEITPTGTPPSARSSHSAIYDPVRHQMVVFAGTESFTSYQNDVWTLSLGGAPAWTQLLPSGPLPPLRESHTAIYDVNRDRMVIFGGDAGGGYYYEDTWSLELGPNAWRSLAPAGFFPGPRWGHVAIYDLPHDRMAMFGGWGWGVGYTSSVWFLEWAGPVPVELADFTAISDGERVVVRWRTAVESDNLGFFVQRAGEAGDDYARVSALIESSGTAGSTYEFIDQEVTPGQTYCYRLESAALNGDSQTYGSVRVLVAPVTSRFVLHPNRPNPFNPATIIPFELPASGEVTIAVYDGGGRLVRTLWTGPMGPGVHQVEWDGLDAAGQAAASGVYFCRLEAAGMQSTRKMVLAQ